MGFLDETPNLDVKLSVIETLRTVTEGKVCFFMLSLVVRYNTWFYVADSFLSM